MARETKANVEMAQTFDQLEIRLGRITDVQTAVGVPKPAYKLTIDFGKFGCRTSIGRFTQHSPEELMGVSVLGVLNLGERRIGDNVSEALILGVQFPRADSGEATPVVPLSANVKIGGKLF